MATKPVRVQLAWKHSDKRMNVFTKAVDQGLTALDSNEELEGVQNPFELDNITFRADCPGIDVFAIGIGPAGGHKSPGFWRAGLQFTIKEDGGIDAQQKTFDVLAPGSPLDIAITDHLEGPSGEIMRIEGITPGTPNYTLTVERKAHGTDPEAVPYDGKLELLTPRVGMKRIILQGDTEPLAAPVMATPQGQESAILLSWSHAYSDVDLLRLKGWKIYYSKTAEIDLEDPETYDGTFDVEGIDKFTLFSPKSAAGLADVNTTYYFAMVALTKCLKKSVLSNEVSGKIYGTIGPMPGGPVVPKAWISVDVNFRLLLEAGNNTDGQPQIGVQNVDTATFEVYSAPVGLGNPTTGDPDENQTLLGTLIDKSNPYSQKLGVTEYIDYWARVKFTDGEGQVSDWGIAISDPETEATVLTLSKKNFTTDTGVPGGVTIEARVQASYKISGIWRNRTLFGISATSNIDSGDGCQFFMRINGEGTFNAGNDDPFGVGTNRITRVGGKQTTCIYAYGEGQKLEIVGRVHNNYGWSPWTTPEEVTLLKEFEGDDIDVCNLAGFGAWTLENPPPGGWSTDIPAPTGEEIVFTFDLGEENESTVFQVNIEAEKSSSFPTETVRYSDSTPGLTLVGVAGSYTLILSGPDLDIEANALQDKCVRIGRCPGKNIYETLQVLQIASNTASVDGVTTITSKGTEALYVTSHYGGSQVYQYWQIIDKPIWSLVDYYEDIRVDPEYFGALPAKTQVLKRNITGVKCRARAHNQWGRGGYRESDSTAGGSAEAGSAVYKSIGGIENDDVKDGTFTSIKTEKKLQPKFSSVHFAPTSNNSLAWSNGEIEFGDQTTNSLGSGSLSSMGLNTKYWFYFTPGSGTRTVYNSTSMADANSGARVVIAVALTTSNTDEMLTVEDLAGGGSTIGASSIIVKELAMLCGTAVYLTAGVMRSAESGARIEIDTPNGFRNIDGDEITRVQIPASSSKIILTDSVDEDGNPVAGYIIHGHAKVSEEGISPTINGLYEYRIGFGYDRDAGYLPWRWEDVYVDVTENFEVRCGTAEASSMTFKINNLTGVDISHGTVTGVDVTIDMHNITLDASGNLTVAAKLEAPIVECDALRPKTNAAADFIKIYEPGGTNWTSTIYANNGADDAGFAAGDGDTAIRGLLWATAQTSGTPRAGISAFSNESGAVFYMWVDHASPANLRIHDSDPGANDTLGVVVATLA